MTEAARLRGAWKCGGRTVALFMGAGVKRGYQSTKLYHFEAFLRLSLEGLGVTDSLPGASAFAPNMDELFDRSRPPPQPRHDRSRNRPVHAKRDEDRWTVSR